MLDVEKITIKELFELGGLTHHTLNINNIIKHGLTKSHDFALVRQDNKIVSIVEYSFNDDNIAEVICLHESNATKFIDEQEYNIKLSDFLRSEKRQEVKTYH